MTNEPTVAQDWSSVRIDRTRAIAEEKRRDADAATERRLREAETRTRLEQERRASMLVEARERAAQRRDATADRRAARKARHQAWAQLAVGLVGRAQTGSAAAWSSVVYGLAVAVAAAGQISVAEHQGLPWFAGLGIAGFVEGLALAMALTARSMRLSGERARIPRILTWVSAIFAASVNLYAHRGDPVEAAVFAAASIAGISLWEIRGEAKTREQMRHAGAAMRTQRAEDVVLRELAGVIETEAREAAAAGDTDTALAALAHLEMLHRRAAAVRAAAVMAADRLAADPTVLMPGVPPTGAMARPPVPDAPVRGALPPAPDPDAGNASPDHGTVAAGSTRATRPARTRPATGTRAPAAGERRAPARAGTAPDPAVLADRAEQLERAALADTGRGLSYRAAQTALGVRFPAARDALDAARARIAATPDAPATALHAVPPPAADPASPTVGGAERDAEVTA